MDSSAYSSDIGIKSYSEGPVYPTVKFPRVAIDSIYRESTFRNYSLAGILVLSITCFFVFTQPATLHWFLIPTIACGLLTGADLVCWLKGELDAFDPKGLVGLILFHGWFLAPLLHVYWGHYGYDLNLPLDPRPWLGVAVLMNLIGIICYKAVQGWVFQRTKPVSTSWNLVTWMLLLFLVLATPLATMAQAVFYQKYFAAMSLGRIEQAYHAMKGTGWLLMLGDSLPMLLSLFVIASTPSASRRRTWFLVGFVLLGLAAAQFVWSGLRGSRSAFVGVMFFSTCLIHFWWRRLRVLHLLLALLLLLPFMYYYAFYKAAGAEAVKAFDSEEERERLERQTRRTFPGMILGDLARVDVQSRICQEIATGENGYQWRWGLTYLEALAKLIPYNVWEVLLGDLSFKDRWNKAFAFTELRSGIIDHRPFYRKSSRIYGLSGEAMLNFGFWGVVPAWLLFGLMMGWVRFKFYSLPRHDARWLLMPYVIAYLIFIPNSDLDNILFMAVKTGLVLFLLVFICSRRSVLRSKAG